MVNSDPGGIHRAQAPQSATSAEGWGPKSRQNNARDAFRLARGLAVVRGVVRAANSFVSSTSDDVAVRILGKKDGG